MNINKIKGYVNNIVESRGENMIFDSEIIGILKDKYNVSIDRGTLREVQRSLYFDNLLNCIN